MSIQSEITRLTTAKSDIATAITNKGVTVPSGTKIDGLAALINGIETKEPYTWKKYELTTILPSGHIPVEYIQSSGTQYINTGFNPNNNTRVVIDLSLTTSSVSSAQYFYGAITAANSGKWFGGGYISNTNLEVWFNNVCNLAVDSAATRRTIDHNKNTITINNGTPTTVTTSTFQCNFPMFLFSMNAGGMPIGAEASARLYSCQIYNNGTLVRDLIPCTNASGTAGLYDVVNSVFYTNAGSGTFVVGAEAENTTRGDFVEEVTSFDENAYPYNGIQDGYYYERVGATYTIEVTYNSDGTQNLVIQDA